MHVHLVGQLNDSFTAGQADLPTSIQATCTIFLLLGVQLASENNKQTKQKTSADIVINEMQFWLEMPTKFITRKGLEFSKLTSDHTNFILPEAELLH